MSVNAVCMLTIARAHACARVAIIICKLRLCCQLVFIVARVCIANFAIKRTVSFDEIALTRSLRM